MDKRTRKLRWAPHEYQLEAVKWLLQRKYAALFLDPGLGKTSTFLKAFCALQDAGHAGRALVVAPRRVCYEVWTHKHGGELDKWVDFKDLHVSLLHGPKKDEALKQDADLYLINPEGLMWATTKPKGAKSPLDYLLSHGVDCLVIDELSKFKHATSKRFKALKPYLPRFNRRYGLTGSPASNGLMDLFGQAFVIDRGAALGQYVTHYRARYFDMSNGYRKGGTFRQYELREGSEAAIYKAIEPWALSMRAVDHLDLPTLVEQDLYVELPPKAREVYDDLEKHFIAAIDGGVITAANAAVKGGKCRQVASGGIYSQEPGEKRISNYLHQAKVEALADLVGELQGKPLLIGYEFDHDLEQIRKKLGNVPAINGAATDKQTDELIRAWNKGELPVLCGHPASMGHGLNLQSSGSHICWYTLPWNFEHYDQMNRRIWRQGQNAERVYIYRLLARDTLDQRVSQVIHTKRRKQDSLMKALRQPVRTL